VEKPWPVTDERKLMTMRELAQLVMADVTDIDRMFKLRKICGITGRDGAKLFFPAHTMELSPEGTLRLKVLASSLCLNTRQVARLLGVTTRAVTKAARRGHLPCIQTKRRGRMYFPVTELRRALDRHIREQQDSLQGTLRQEIEREAERMAVSLLADVLDRLRDLERVRMLRQALKKQKLPRRAVSVMNEAQPGGTMLVEK
jgi:hypothetical protein